MRLRPTYLAAGIFAVAGSSMTAAGALMPMAMRPPAPPAAVRSEAPASAPVPASSRAPRLGRSAPVHLDIPTIGVHTGVMTLGLAADGTVALPPLRSDAPAGWYRYLATPGEVGTAVILGHVDTARSGPAVFYRLGALRPGDMITVDRADGSRATFAVTSLGEYPKTAFPTATVYGPAAFPALRLITCGGSFDRTRGSYRANIVVYARLTAATPARGPTAQAGSAFQKAST